MVHPFESNFLMEVLIALQTTLNTRSRNFLDEIICAGPGVKGFHESNLSYGTKN